jgi:hypothetical protein
LFPQLLIGHSHSPAMKLCALSTLYDSENGIFEWTGHVTPQKPWLEPVLWAREELNLRPLPCQIPPRISRTEFKKSYIVRNRGNPAVEERWRPGAGPMNRHGSLAPYRSVRAPVAARLLPVPARHTQR